MKIRDIVFSVGLLFLGKSEAAFDSRMPDAISTDSKAFDVVNFTRLAESMNKPSKEFSEIVDANDAFHYESLYSDVVDPNGQNPVRSTEIVYTSGGNNDLNNLTADKQKLLLSYIECVAGLSSMSLDRHTLDPKPSCTLGFLHFMEPIEKGLDYVDNTLFANGKFNSVYVFDNLLSGSAQRLLRASAEETVAFNRREASKEEMARGAFVSLLAHVLLSAKRPYNLLFPLGLEKYNHVQQAGKDNISMITKDDLRNTINKSYAPLTKENGRGSGIDAGQRADIYETLIKQNSTEAELGRIETRAYITNKTLVRLHALRNKIGQDATAEVIALGKGFIESMYSGLLDACQNNDGKVLFAASDFSEKLIKYLDKHWAFATDKVNLYLTRAVDLIASKTSSIKNWISNKWETVAGIISSAINMIRQKIPTSDVIAKKHS